MKGAQSSEAIRPCPADCSRGLRSAFSFRCAAALLLAREWAVLSTGPLHAHSPRRPSRFAPMATCRLTPRGGAEIVGQHTTRSSISQRLSGLTIADHRASHRARRTSSVVRISQPQSRQAAWPTILYKFRCLAPRSRARVRPTGFPAPRIGQLATVEWQRATGQRTASKVPGQTPLERRDAMRPPGCAAKRRAPPASWPSTPSGRSRTDRPQLAHSSSGLRRQSERGRAAAGRNHIFKTYGEPQAMQQSAVEGEGARLRSLRSLRLAPSPSPPQIGYPIEQHWLSFGHPLPPGTKWKILIVVGENSNCR